MKTAIAVFVLLAGASAASAQAQQTVTFAADSAGISGGTRSGCVGNDWWLNPNVRSIRFTWTDTTGAKVGQVRIEASMRWGYYARNSMNLAVEVNDVLQPEPLVSPSGQPGNCGLNLVTNVTLEAGITEWNASGQNSLVLTVPSDGTAVFSNAGPWIVQFVVTALNQPPDAPSLLAQVDVAGKVMPVGATTKFKGGELRAIVTDPDGDVVFIEAEIKPTTVFFTGVPNAIGLPVASGSTASAALAGLADVGFHWQVRAVDANGERSAWVSFGSNSEVAADFKVDSAIAAASSSGDSEDHGAGDCALSSGSAPAGLALLAFAVAMGWILIRRR